MASPRTPAPRPFVAEPSSDAYHRRMPQQVHVHFLPTHFEPEQLRGGVAVVIDVLRASTTIVHALAAGATRVIPCETVEEARAIAANLPANSYVLGGERGGVRIEGFHLGNSPLEYTADSVGGKTVVFTTTNGTRALARCRYAERILIGALVNGGEAATALLRDGRPAHLVCAGTDGRISAEDVVCAGAIAEGLLNGHRETTFVEDAAWIAREFWTSQATNAGKIADALRQSHGGRNLIQLGYEADVEQAARCGGRRFLPEYDSQRNELRLAGVK